MNAVNITVYAGPSYDPNDDERPPSVKRHENVALRDVAGMLDRIGTEFKTADYFPNRQVIITIDQVESEALNSTVKDATSRLMQIATELREAL